MTFGRNRLEFLHDLLDIHVEAAEKGLCERCTHPARWFPCETRRKIVERLIQLDHVTDEHRKPLVNGRITCPCRSSPPHG